MVKVEIKMTDKNAVVLNVKVQNGSLSDLITATSSLVDHIVARACGDPVAIITDAAKEEIIDLVMTSVKERLIDIKNTKKEEVNNA